MANDKLIQVFNAEKPQVVPLEECKVYVSTIGDISRREKLNIAWKALESVGFTRGIEFADDDVMEMLSK